MDKTQKKKRRQVITWISLVALVALLVFLNVFRSMFWT